MSARAWKLKRELVAVAAALWVTVALAQTPAEPMKIEPGVALPATNDAAPAAKADEAAPEGRKVFYASHSLMWDIPAILAEQTTAVGIKGHTLVGLQRIGFSRTQQHWDQAEAQNQAKQALKAGKVDDFVMSPMDLPDTGIDNFVKLGLENNPKMRFFLQNNWAGFNNDGQLARQMQRGPAWDVTTVEQLKTLNTTSEKAFETQVKLINERSGRTVIYIIPTSEANSTLRAKIINKEFEGLDRQSQLFADFIGHPTAPLWTLNSYIHFATIYGKSPIGLPIPSVLKRANNAKWDEKFNKSLQELAWKTVTEYPFSGVKAPEAGKSEASKSEPAKSEAATPEPAKL